MTRIFRRLLLLPILAAAAACADAVGPGDVATVEVSPGEGTVLPGTTVQYTATAKDVDGDTLTGRTVAWSSSNTAVATVDAATGLATAVAPGTATITATSEGQSGSGMLTVVAVPVSSLRLSPDSAVVAAGATQAFTATARDASGNVLTGRTLAWASSNTAVATVNGSGQVTGVGPGTATITASTEGVSASAPVRVTGAAATLTVTPPNPGVVLGATLQLTATLRDAAGSVVTGTVTWATSNSGVASVDATGKVTGVSEGTATITASGAGKTGSVTVTVSRLELEAETITAGIAHTCGLTASGAAYCWGANASGQLGDGSVVTRTVPTPVLGALVFTSLTAGGDHTCGLTAAGTAYCWGANSSGQLGDGTTTNRTTPTAVGGGHVFRVISAGDYHTCGVTTAGAAFCWGANGYGDLGTGDPNFLSTTTPVAVTGGHSFVTISAGNGITVALKASGEAWAWGKCDIIGVTLVQQCDNFYAEPGAVLGGHQFVKVSAGGVHICALEPTGAAWCWGYDSGNGYNTRTRVPRLVPGGLTFVSIDAGYQHTVALTASGAAYAWGYNRLGQVGNGSSEYFIYGPVAVAGGHTFRSIAAGTDHSAAVATDGHAFAWGGNASGQLGNGTTTGSSTPTPVSGSVVFR